MNPKLIINVISPCSETECRIQEHSQIHLYMPVLIALSVTNKHLLYVMLGCGSKATGSAPTG